MPVTPTLTPVHVRDLTGVSVVAVDIEDAAEYITTHTNLSPDEYVDTVGLASGPVRRAWAIVAARLHVQTHDAGAEGMTAESQQDYSYSRDLGAAGEATDLLHGLPRRLLGLSHGQWGRIGQGSNVHPFWDDLPLHDPLGHHEDLSYLYG